MDDFRSETLIQFIRTKTQPYFLKFLWIAGALILVLLFILALSYKSMGIYICIVFILLGLIAQSLAFYAVTYQLYSYGRDAYSDIKKKGEVILLNDVGVFVRGFDFLDRKTYWKLNIDRTIYLFNKADIILGGTSMVLLGKGLQFGSTTYASPVEITIAAKQTRVATAELLSWTEQQGRIVIGIQDSRYSKPLKIEFKDQVDEIKHWLTSN